MRATPILTASEAPFKDIQDAYCVKHMPCTIYTQFLRYLSERMRFPRVRSIFF